MTSTIAEPPAMTVTAPNAGPVAASHRSTHVLRFDRPTLALHIVVMVTFLGLAATGMPLLFSDAPWARALAMLFFGFQGAGLAHRFFGLVLLGAVVWHLANVFWRAFVRGESGLFWGPDSMVPQPRTRSRPFSSVNPIGADCRQRRHRGLSRCSTGVSTKIPSGVCATSARR